MPSRNSSEATADEYEPRLEQVIRTAYADAFTVVDPATDSDQAISDAFRFYHPAAQRDKMVTLFMGICEAAGIIGADRAPRKRLRTERLPSGRKTVVEDGAKPKPLRAKGKIRRDDEAAAAAAAAAAERPGAPSGAHASCDLSRTLRLRYIDMLMNKAEAQDEPDTDFAYRIRGVAQQRDASCEVERED